MRKGEGGAGGGALTCCLSRAARGLLQRRFSIPVI